jgi:hypothetical protein
MTVVVGLLVKLVYGIAFASMAPAKLAQRRARFRFRVLDG